MKKILLILGVLIITLSVAVGCGKEAEESTGDKTKLIVGVDDAFPPMTYREEGSNDLIGFDVDMGEEIAKRIGVELEWQPVEWKGIVQSLKTNKIDLVICGMTITPERQEQIIMSEPYMDAGISIAVPKGATGLDSKEAIKDAKLGVQTGSSGAQALEELGLGQVSFYDAYPAAFNDLSIGRIDAVIVDTVVGAYFIQGKPDTYEMHPNAIVKEQYGIGIKKENTELEAKVNKALKEMMADGTLEEIATKWFGAETAKEIIPK